MCLVFLFRLKASEVSNDFLYLGFLPGPLLSDLYVLSICLEMEQ